MTTKSWRTTVLGITTIVAAVAGIVQATLDSDPATNPDMTVAVAAILSGLGLIFARDAKASAYVEEPK
jgi:anti-sigma-K factor RskA